MPAAITTLKSLLDAEAQTNRLLRLNFSKGDGPAGVLMVANRLDADEGLSRDFRFTVQVISDSATLSLKDVVGKLVSVELMRDDGSVRHFNGHVFELSFVRNDGGLAYYDMVLLPWLTFLRYRVDNDLFHGKTVQEQIESIFGDYPDANWRMQNLGADEAQTDSFQNTRASTASNTAPMPKRRRRPTLKASKPPANTSAERVTTTACRPGERSS